MLNPTLYPIYLPELIAQPAEDHPEAGVPTLDHLNAPGYEPTLVAVPDYSNTAVVAKGKFQRRITLAPRSYLWAVAATSSHADGFKWQLIDNATATPLLNQRTDHSATTGQGTVQGITFPLMILERPRLILAPAVLTAQVENLAAASNSIQLVFFFAEKRP